MTAVPELIRVQRHLEGLDPVEVAFRAINCLDAENRSRLQARFNEVFGKCTPPLTINFQDGVLRAGHPEQPEEL